MTSKERYKKDTLTANRVSPNEIRALLTYKRNPLGQLK